MYCCLTITDTWGISNGSDILLNIAFGALAFVFLILTGFMLVETFNEDEPSLMSKCDEVNGVMVDSKCHIIGEEIRFDE